MRLIGKIQNKFHAERFMACMTVKEIGAHLEHDNSEWEIWIKDEDRVAIAKQEFEEFLLNPDAPKYGKVMDEASKLIKQQQQAYHEHKKNLVNVQQQWQTPLSGKKTPVTIVVIVISLLVSLATQMGEDRESLVFRALAFTSLTKEQTLSISNSPNPNSTAIRTGSIRHFELWRTITPMFIHFGLMHLLFNSIWIFYFGRQIEARYGSVWLAMLIVIFAIPSNSIGAIVPLEWDGLPVDASGKVWIMPAGGLSGVIYGLFGYLWMKMLFDPRSNFFVSPVTIVILMGWFLLCIVASGDSLGFGRINNWAHGGGLVMGLIMGYLPKFIADIRGTSKMKTK
ncbi:MAG TPA: rhomboid family intramembrane serine protease [Pirellulaceae bacterium]|nr:rhomboid family intramembrane serine protease [Pirellulaceae bacterium]HMO90732.1 rhomboid family intramembrane serine protease [Pirellulaceae bacterium]HMP67983.1 rhomboid family intramembrane serine protease [Pirellulaceae bacterium]